MLMLEYFCQLRHISLKILDVILIFLSLNFSNLEIENLLLEDTITKISLGCYLNQFDQIVCFAEIEIAILLLPSLQKAVILSKLSELLLKD